MQGWPYLISITLFLVQTSVTSLFQRRSRSLLQRKMKNTKKKKNYDKNSRIAYGISRVEPINHS